MHWCTTRGLEGAAARHRRLRRRGRERRRDRRRDRRSRHERFAELLDRLAYEPGRNDKLRLMTDYFRTTPDPERGCALAALTGALSFQHAKPGMIRALIAERTDPVLFELSYDYVGDLSETVALMWPADPAQARRTPTPSLSEVVDNARDARQVAAARRSSRAGSTRSTRPAAGRCSSWSPAACASASRRGSPRPRRPRSAARTPDEIELLWPGLAPPYVELFAWLEGRADKPVSARSGAVPPGDAGACDRGDRSSPRSIPPTSWPNGNGTASACRRSPARRRRRARRAALFAHRRGHLQELSRSGRGAAASTARSTASC